jgi:hypothetical protein
MVTPHVVIMMSPKNKPMILHAELLLNSLILQGNCKEFYISFVVPETEVLEFPKKFLLKPNVDIVTYTPTNCKTSWSHSPRWFVNAKSDLYLAIDSDAIICRDLNAFLYECVHADALSAVQAILCPFDENAYETWKKIYKNAGLDLPDILYMYRYRKQNIWDSLKHDCVGPFYPNCGVIALPSNYLQSMQLAIIEATKIVLEVVPNNYFIPQIVIALALSLSKIPVNILSPQFNATELFDSFDDAIIYHYNTSRDSITRKIDFNFIKNKNLQKLFFDSMPIYHL